MLVKSFKLVKKEVPGFLKDKFGDHFAQISTDTTMKLRSSVKDVARVYMKSVPFEIEELTKKFINAPQGVDDPRHVFGYESGDGWVQGSIEYDTALREYVSKYPEQFKVVKSVLGLRRAQGRHASSFAIGNRSLQEFIPTVDIGGVRCTQYTAVSVEKSGAIKNDYLVVNSLNDISECVRLVQQGHNVPLSCIIKNKMVPRVRLLPYQGELVDIWALPEDQKVFNEVAAGRTETVFQFSTAGAIKWLEFFNKKRPDGSLILNSILQMAIFTALDRPGPLDAFVEAPDGAQNNMLVEYTRRAQGFEWAETPRIFKDLLPETLGILVMQEQVQRIYQTITDCSGPEAEKFRSNVGKKKKLEIDKAYPIFINKATEKYGIDDAKKCWEAIQTFSSYGFCIDEDQLIQTSLGDKKIKELTKLDKIAFYNIKNNCIEYEFPTMIWESGEKEVFEVELEDGTLIKGTEDHKFLYEGEWVSLKNLIYDIQEVTVCQEKELNVNAENQ